MITLKFKKSKKLIYNYDLIFFVSNILLDLTIIFFSNLSLVRDIHKSEDTNFSPEKQRSTDTYNIFIFNN